MGQKHDDKGPEKARWKWVTTKEAFARPQYILSVEDSGALR